MSRRQPLASPPDDPVHGIDRVLGEALRAIRRQRDRSLQSVAEAAGISVGHLSQLERGLTSGTVRDLLRVSQALGTDLARLLASRDATAGSPYVVRNSQRHSFEFSEGVTKDVLTPSMDGMLRMYMVRLAPHGASGDESYAHDGDEAGLVIRGQLLLTIDGVEHLLEEGDSFGFPSRLPHRFRNPADAVALVLWANMGVPLGVAPAKF
jgi:transcriptional regulator with XRE-family HTH domain